MKMQLIGKGNLPLLTFILDGCSDDSILNISALARRLSCSRSSLLDRIQNHVRVPPVVFLNVILSD